MRKLQLLSVAILIAASAFAQKSVRSMAPTTLIKKDATVLNRQAEGDTVFFYDSNFVVFGNENDGGDDFELMNLDLDSQQPAASDTYDTEWMNFYSTDLTDINPGDFVQDTAFYFAACSWFADPNIAADNWLGMGPITIPDAGAELSWFYKSVGTWIDGYDVYITTGGMEPYGDIDPGFSPYPIFHKEEAYPITNASDTIWNQYSASLNDWAGERVYFTFHHNSTDKEMIMLDNFLIVETNNMAINETELNGISIFPNPSNGVFTVTSNEADIYTIEVMNVLGEVVSTKTIEGMINESFDMSNYNAGLYFVKVANGTSENVQRVIIK